MPNKKSLFKKGNKHARGGKREGAGRKPDWFKEKMQEIATRQEAIQFIEDVVIGKDVDEFITDQGECIPHRASAAVRHKVWADAADRGFGKAVQETNVTGAGGVNIFQLIREAEEERGLPSSFDD